MKLSKSFQILKLSERIKGPKGSSREPTAVKDPKTKETIVSTQGIKDVVLDYCTDVLRNNEPKEEFKEELKVKELILDVRFASKLGKGPMIPHESLKKNSSKIRKGKKKTYDFLIKGGEKF